MRRLLGFSICAVLFVLVFLVDAAPLKSAAAGVTASQPRVIFEDRFDGKLGEGWTWIREKPGSWRIEKDSLQIRVEPGLADTVKNALVRAAPDRMKGKFAIDVTVTNAVRPTNQYEQAGITWYTGGKPVFKIVKECIDGGIYIIPGKIPVDDVSMQLRLVVSPEGFVAQFRPEGKGEFRTAAEGKLPAPSGDQVSIQCYNGPPAEEHWIRFNDFQILDLEAKGKDAGAAKMPFLHPLFTDHMVLQRDVPVPVWGWTEPGKQVKVTLAGQSAAATADGTGRWLVKLGPLPAGGPHALEVTGPERAALSDVLVGDVWICSGQSNMQMSVASSDRAADEIAAANHPRLRLFTVPNRIALEPQSLVQGAWQLCTPQSVPGFSAVGYFFGRDLLEKLDVPIGLINSSWGGTLAEAWTSAEALSTMEDFRPAVKQLQEQVDARKAGTSRFDEQMDRWWKQADPGSASGAGWADPSHDAADWKTMDLPAAWESAGLDGFDGLVWFRKEVDLPASWAGKEAVLHLGPIDDRDTTWVNGVRVGEGDRWDAPRDYRVRQGTLLSGRNVVAVRVLDTGGEGGLRGQPGQLRLECAGGQIPAVSLAGAWKYKAATTLDKLPPVPQRIDSNPNVVTVLYNGMIAPLVPFAIKGAIWYQGESNAGNPEQYRRLLPTLIRDWRSRFGVGDFPFLVVQLANFMAPQVEPVEAGWAGLREAQLMTAQADPKVGLAVIIDIGAANDIHPKNKQDVGMRLALAALAIGDGKKIEYSGPIYSGMEVRGREAHLKFTHVGGGLLAKGGDKLKGFAIAGEDKKFQWADAAIQGETVVVSSPKVERPVAVRYGWANNPDCNLYNKEGLPASPFRTDVDAK